MGIVIELDHWCEQEDWWDSSLFAKWKKIYIINTNSAVFLDQFVRQINSEISVVYSEVNRRYFLTFQSFCLLWTLAWSSIHSNWFKEYLNLVKLQTAFKSCYTQYHHFENKGVAIENLNNFFWSLFNTNRQDLNHCCDNSTGYIAPGFSPVLAPLLFSPPTPSFPVFFSRPLFSLTDFIDNIQFYILSICW